MSLFAKTGQPQSPRAPCSRASIPDLLLGRRHERPGAPGCCHQGTRADCGADWESSDPRGRGWRPSQRSQASPSPRTPRALAWASAISWRCRRHAMASHVTTAPCSVMSSHRIRRNCACGFTGLRQPRRAAGPDGQLPSYPSRKRARLRRSLVREGNERVMREARRETTGKPHQDHRSAFLLEHASSLECRGSPSTPAVSCLVWRSSTDSAGSDPMNEYAGFIDPSLHADSFLGRGARGVARSCPGRLLPRAR